MNVSVVLPSFNRARLLPITIPTYFQEDVSEVILVDDCSSDNTAEVVKELQTRFPTLRYFRNEVNSKQPYTQSLEYPPNCSRLTQQDLIIRELEEKRRSWADS